ncbi:hypothetical protein Clacol_000192 [Clathrus columnatus]|uniref:Uncharacterized protein n=1 Tax=Clathrus columnatus TaxID=1419009 RepID=A0AAV4ZZ68_9AGAM|nr:hypothetical protein Clacol_000192 [Clathrus columnatus]
MDNETISISESLYAQEVYWDITEGQTALAALYLFIVHIATSTDIVLFCNNIAIILSDVLAFIGIIYQVWGIWKSKRSVGLQSNHKKDLVTSLLQQALLRRKTKNSTPNLSDIHLPTMSLPSQDDPAQTQRSILERLHESLVAEMAEPDPANNPNSGEPDIDDSQVTSPDNVYPTNNAI